MSEIIPRINEMDDFLYEFKDILQRKCILTAPITVPLQISVHEYACRLIQAYSIPCYLEQELTNALEEYVNRKTEIWHRNNTQELVKRMQNNEINVDSLVSAWCTAFTEEHVAFSGKENITNEQVFSDMYHSLVHSPALDTLLSVEHSYAVQMEALVKERDSDLTKLQAKQAQEMEKAVESVGTLTTDKDVNDLAVTHLENIQMVESKWESEISALRELQKREFQEWVAKVHEDYHALGGSVRFLTKGGDADGLEGSDHWSSGQSRLEESFTIHLGAQMKQMHNLRLLSADVLDLCRYRPVAAQNVVPQRLQTAMSLYSNNLCGLVILVDSRINSYTGIKRDFARVCQTSTEFHFKGIEEQLEVVRDLLPRVAHWRSANEVLMDDGRATNKAGSATTDNQSPQVAMLRPGDFYITHHSNLAEVHVLFHVIVDDSIRCPDLSSRHQVILALRNALKVACLCDITTVTLPLLLVHEMSEEMTMSWCLKRAELVYKCVKGFMIEMASWGGSENRIVQFLVPKGISDDLFSNLSSMLPSIFRPSNPLKATLN